MFRAAMEAGQRIGLLASFQPSLAPMRDEFETMALDAGASVLTACAPNAMDALHAGDGSGHDSALVEVATELVDCEMILLAQFSTARAKDVVQEATGKPVLTSPDSAVSAMRRRLMSGVPGRS